MKFAHDFKATLASQGFPPHWVNRAIPYGQLKKCLKKVQRELEDLGLDAQTLRALLDPHTTSPVALQYRLRAASNSNFVRPKLTLYLHLQDGVAVDASLTPTSRCFFERIVAEMTIHDNRIACDQSSVSSNILQDADDAEPLSTIVTLNYDRIEVPLVFDGEFFSLLQNDVISLDALQTEEEQKITSEVVALGNNVSHVSRPSRFSKSDLGRWRRIFELYINAQIFFATNERDHGVRSSVKALEQLRWFQNEVDKRELATSFNLGKSKLAFSKFLVLNANLLKNLQFQELNKLAVSKILKKFDKRTALSVSQTFPTVIQSEGLLSRDLAKDMCAHLSEQLVAVVPQLSDFLCPICFAVAYRPVRLDCQHIFCIRCVVKIQRRQESTCPLCRAHVVMRASADNLDEKLRRFLKKYFPEEVKEKQRANEIERGIEEYGPGYKHQDCVIM
ncbi:hypothetical protein CDD81_5146 [Ophiocordyceps australis]|uniref:RING-14 protein n=1 Tax=Ophiocordyceps australis TaxID=1399860 RepID=A0A2C5XU24_9HYPO|nr:hypothetical protein CDD81_5146 [Ophiocordyceps australis]